MLAILLQKPSERLISSLTLSSFKSFKLYVPSYQSIAAVDDDRLDITEGTLDDVKEDFVVLFSPGVDYGRKALGRLSRCIEEHPEFDVYHLNVEDAPKMSLKSSEERLFKDLFIKGLTAPLGSFAFRTSVLKEKVVRYTDGEIDPIATVIACTGENGVRTVRWASVSYTEPAVELTPEQAESLVWQRIEFLRWSESYFGDEDYPLTVGKSFKLFATEIAKLYPSRSKDELKGIMEGFETVKGPVRKLMASSALKSALKARSEELSDPLG